VQSVDLVADPATTRGLFEATSASPAAWAELDVESLRRHRPDLVEALGAAPQEELARLREEVGRLRAVEATQKKRTVMGRLLREFELPNPETDHPEEKLIVSEAFVESLLQTPDELAMRQLVEERSRLVHALRRSRVAGGGGRPTSRDQNLVYGGAPMDTKAFVAAIT
jgi:hypothetical protein